MLIVMENRNVEDLPQSGLDLEAARRGDVLEIDAAVGRGEVADRVDDRLGVLGVEADRPGIDVGEPFEQRGLALHDGHRGCRPDVAEPEHGRAVADDRDRVALDRQPAGVLGILGDRQADPRHPGCVGTGQIVAGTQGHLRFDADLAAQVHQERAVTDLAHLESRQPCPARR